MILEEASHIRIETQRRRGPMIGSCFQQLGQAHWVLLICTKLYEFYLLLIILKLLLRQSLTL